jgi:hypothetical protein
MLQISLTIKCVANTSSNRRIIDLVRRQLSLEERGGDEGDGADADVPDSPRYTDAQASFNHKVPEWLALCSVGISEDAEDENPSDGQNQHFADGAHQHADDEEPPDIDELPDLARYRRALCQSPAYQWLLAALQAQRSLAVPGGHRCVRTQIRRAIVDALRPRRKLSRRDAGGARMRFKVDWDPLWFHEGQRYNEPIEDVLERAVTITGHGNEVQVATCLEYMTQTWPQTGPALLKSLQAAVTEIRGRDRWWVGEQTFLSKSGRPRLTASLTDAGSLPSGTAVYASLEKATDERSSSLTLAMKVFGNVFAIAEVGEQLAWLGAALRSSPPGDTQIMACTPMVTVSTDSSRNLSTPVTCEIRFDLNSQEVDHSAQGSCWRGLFKNPVIVGGFPIPRRSTTSAETGAQMPLAIAGSLINSSRVVKWAGTTYLKGFSALLAATKVVGDTVFWHLVYKDDGSYISYEDPRVPRWPESADPFVVDAATRNYQHVVGWCDRIISHAGKMGPTQPNI